MAKTYGGIRGGGASGREGDSSYKGSIKNVESLVKMKDPKMSLEVFH